MKKTLTYIGLTLFLMISGFLLSNYFFEISLAQLGWENTRFVSTTMGEQFYAFFFFALALGSLPVLYLIAHRFSRLKFTGQSIIAAAIITIFGMLAWEFRILRIKRRLQLMSDYIPESGNQNIINYGDLHFGGYLFAGFVIGTLVCILIFRSKNNTSVKQ